MYVKQFYIHIYSILYTHMYIKYIYIYTHTHIYIYYIHIYRTQVYLVFVNYTVISKRKI